jgi:hypothetical protein
MQHGMHLTDLQGTINMQCPDCQDLIRGWLPQVVTRHHDSPVQGWMLELDNESINEAVRLAVAAAATCWVPAPTGEYQQEWAGQIVEELVQHLRKLMLSEGIS